MLRNALGGREHLYKNTETLTLTSHVVICSYTNIYRIISVNAHLIGWYVKLSVTPGAGGNMQEDREGSFAAFKVTLILGAQL